MTNQKPRIVKKSVKHTFSADERASMSSDLLNALAARDNAEAEFDSIKATYKAKITDAESKVGLLAATLRANWEMRVKEVEVRYRVADKKKDFFLPNPDGTSGSLVKLLTEDMTPEDFTMELIEAENAFSKKTALALWDAGNDHGVMVIGQLGESWYAAIRANVGSQKLEERLDSLQRSYKKRWDAVEQGANRCMEWLLSNLGKDNAKGFVEPLHKAIEGQRDKAE